MRRLLFLFFLLFALGLFGADAAKPDVVKKFSDGSINFTKREMTVRGDGMPGPNVVDAASAVLAAEKMAARNARNRAIAALSSLKLADKKSLKDFFAGQGKPDFISDLVKKSEFSQVKSKRYYSNSMVEVTFVINIDAWLLAISEAAGQEILTD
ncbi:hypothetical protein J6Z39_08445 [bacterium]|nr:hypothetical protein [bacterium]